MQYRQDIVTWMPITLVELITYMYSKYTKYLAQLCRRFFAFWNFRLTDKVTIAQQETIPNIWNATVWWPWFTSKRVARVCQHQLSFLLFFSRCYRFPTSVCVDVNHCSECQPDCRSCAADHQRLDSDAEEGHRWFGVFLPELDWIPRQVWIADIRQLLAGTWQGLPPDAAWKHQTENWG